MKNFISSIYKNYFYKFFFVSSVLLFPEMSFAAVCNFGKGITGILLYPPCLIQKLLIPLLLTFALFFFIFGIVRYLTNGDNEQERKKGSMFMLWGTIALAVLFSVWGLVAIVTNTLQFGG